MESKNRYLYNQTVQDLKRKMVFIAGARQVGKTTFSLSISSKKNYLNWDIAQDRERILRQEWPSGKDILILDEIHKYKSWRNLLKGLSDQWKGMRSIIVTGSANLDYYRMGGDSLQGRYHLLRMHPLSVSELGISKKKDLDGLIQFGGFPEPFYSQNETEAKRWSREYRTRLIREDIVSLEKTNDLGNMELLSLRLPDLVGSPLSINSIREDLRVSHRAVSTWLEIFERMYFIFRLSSFGSSKIRAVKKEQKVYTMDWSLIKNPGFRFENLVACHLLKWIHYEEDTKGKNIDLRYFRDVEGREVDFIITEDDQPVLAVECKLDDRDIDPSLKYFKKKFPEAKAYQLSFLGKKDYESSDGIRLTNALNFLPELI